MTITPEPLLSVSIQGPTGVVWEGAARSVSSKNSKGLFDILPHHAHFITIIKKDQIVIRGVKEEKTLSTDRAVMMVENDAVSIYMGL